MNDREQSSPVSKPPTRFRRAAKIVLIYGKWFLIVYSGFSAILVSYFVFPAVLSNIFSRTGTTPPPAPLFSRYDDGNTSTAQVPVEEDDSLPKADTNEAQLLSARPPLPANPLLETPFLPPRKPSFNTGKLQASSQNIDSEVASLSSEQVKEISQNLYLPAILIGDREKRRIIFFWAPEFYESVQYFRRQIAPLINRRQRNYAVLIVQLAASPKNGVIPPGATLFCAKDAVQYQQVVLSYLKNANYNNKEANLGNFLDYTVKTNTNIQSAFNAASLTLNLSQCLKDKFYRYRLAQLHKQNELFGTRFKIGRVPFVVMDGEALNQPDKNTILSLLNRR